MDSYLRDNNNIHYCYKYIIVVDFGATCWEVQPYCSVRESEILEFQAVLLNLDTGKVEAEFHRFLRPVEKPILSSYCLNITILLEEALIQFHEWLRNELPIRNIRLPKQSMGDLMGNCAFVSWSECDFQYFLHNECKRKGIKKPTYFNQWIDIRQIFGKHYFRPKSLTQALNHLGLQFVGKMHSGIDDAKNTAYLAHQLVRDGAKLTLTADMAPSQWNINCFK